MSANDGEEKKYVLLQDNKLERVPGLEVKQK
jgi:hypothetical protein